MRPVKGLDKPRVQWMVIAASMLLAGLLVAATLSMRATASQMRALDEAQRACMSDLQAADAQLARERAAREAFSLELARIRAEQGGTDAAQPDAPTLTLVPPTKRGPMPPDASLTAPDRAQTIQLRLVLPSKAAGKTRGFQIAARDWSTGRPLWSITTAAAATVDGRRAAIAYVAGEMLPAGSYELSVTPDANADVAPEPIALYELTVGK